MDKLHIIDTLGSFVEPTDQEVINWSKVDFSNLETNGRLRADVRRRIEKHFETYTLRIKALGYNAMSFDDLAHLTVLPCYNSSLSLLLRDYSLLYKRLFSIAKQQDIKILINTDYLFRNNDIDNLMNEQHLTNEEMFIKILTIAFESFPEIDGVILRIGENDGKDVKSRFLSRLTLRTPDKTNALLKKALPIFESYNKILIFRTWTVGVYRVGDLIWNKRTFDTVFASIDSNALIISMKFGDTDFMTYLQLNPLFFISNHKKIIELQTRREWEGMGTYPSFVGWDYSRYFQELADNDTIVGIHVWCQTGGWAKKEWTNITFLKNSSFWNELNTYVTVKMYHERCSVESAITVFCHEYTIKDVTEFIRLLQLSEIAIKQGLYIRELAEQQLYFRRLRVPTLLWITWDTISLRPMNLFLIRALIIHPEIAIQEAHTAVTATIEMISIAEKIKLKETVIASLRFQNATLLLFIGIKKHLLGVGQTVDLPKLQRQINTYHSQFPQHYTISRLKSTGTKSRYTHFYHLLLGGLFLRKKSSYRKRDKIFLATSPIQLWIVQYYLRKTKSHLNNQSMGIDVLFR